MNYKKSKIYKLVSSQTDKIYIGSTTKTLAQRLAGHKYHCKNNKQISAKELVKFDDCKIILIEIFECNTVEELRAREYQLIQENKNICVNLHMPSRTKKDWYNDNKELTLQRSKDYYQTNKEKITEKIDCQCGGRYTYCTKARHEKTKKHLAYITT